ncbi:MAG: dephospho-CoA kinase [Lysobacteraceae bacterium]
MAARIPPMIAMTGGVASGKSAAERRFAALGAPVIDADAVSRELVAPGQPALAAIADRFGASMLDADGALDRRRLRERVFADPPSRKALEALLHPLILAEMRSRALVSEDAPYVVLSIPLLIESGGFRDADRVLAIDAPRALQRQRLLARDGVALVQAEAMLDAQASREARLAIADDVVVNDGPLAALDAAVERLDRRYRRLADGIDQATIRPRRSASLTG